MLAVLVREHDTLNASLIRWEVLGAANSISKIANLWTKRSDDRMRVHRRLQSGICDPGQIARHLLTDGIRLQHGHDRGSKGIERTEADQRFRAVFVEVSRAQTVVAITLGFEQNITDRLIELTKKFVQPARIGGRICEDFRQWGAQIPCRPWKVPFRKLDDSLLGHPRHLRSGVVPDAAAVNAACP